MIELPPNLQQPRSPDQRPTPTQMARNFLNRWGYTMSAVQGVTAAVEGVLAVAQFAGGSTTFGLMDIGMATSAAISSGIYLYATHSLKKRQGMQ